MAATARKTSLVWISYDVVVFLLMVGSESSHSCSSVYPSFGSMYRRFHTAWWDYCSASRLISTESLFMSYSLSMSSNSYRLAAR